MRRYCLALDLKNDPVLIAEYDAWHQAVWPEILESIRSAGIAHMEIYRLENRLFMVIDANADFSFEKKAALDSQHEKVQEWEKRMWKYQEAIPGGMPAEKWRLMDLIFSL